jgi:hypothetical protein
MMAVTVGAALLAGCGQEPTAVRTQPPHQARFDLDPLDVSISGPLQPQYNVQCAYVANATGGTPPYTYIWVALNGITGTSSGNTFYGTISSPGAKSLYVTVRDANDEEATTGISRNGTNVPHGCQ